MHSGRKDTDFHENGVTAEKKPVREVNMTVPPTGGSVLLAGRNSTRKGQAALRRKPGSEMAHP